MDSACLDLAGLEKEILAGATFCPTASVDKASVAPSGTASFTSGMTFTNATSMTVSLTMSFPASCLSPATCAVLQAQLQMDTDFQSVSCTGTATCACSVVSVPMVSNETGSYTISGTTLTTTSSVGEVSTTPYCVQGTTAHILEVDVTMNMGSMGSVKILADSILKKQ